ncbi:MAG TPA: glycerophosphodiester phosphodiesterase family protein [Sphingobacteriaceae bacterium]
MLLFTLLNNSMLMVYGQTTHSIVLSKYTFSHGKNEVGSIAVSPASPIKKVTLKGQHAKAFNISNTNQLYIQPAFNKAGIQSYEIEIEVETNAGKIKDSFRLVNNQFIRNRVVAHRGAWKNTETTENSLTALKYAIDLGCEGSEFDVRMSADSVLFVNHDADVQGVVIEKTPSEDLAGITLSNGESLPTLEAYIKTGLNQNKTKLILEIKPTVSGKEHMLTITREVVKLVRKLKAQAWVDYISFSYDACQELTRLDPYARVAYLNGDKSPQEISAGKLWGLDYHYSVFQKNKRWIQEAKKLNLTVNAWTVNDREVMEWLLEQDVEFITTNEPEALLQLTTNR